VPNLGRILLTRLWAQFTGQTINVNGGWFMS
jgi:hypothetical protein